MYIYPTNYPSNKEKLTFAVSPRHPPKPNITKAQSQAIREPKRDRDHIVHSLNSRQGGSNVIMDRQDYINKSNNLLNQPTYSAIPWDATYTIKNKLINIMKRVKAEQV